MFIATLAATVLLAGAPATTETPPPTGAAAPVAKSDDNKQICKTEPLIGSRVPKKVCATKAEWEARRAEDREQLDKMQRSSKPHSGF